MKKLSKWTLTLQMIVRHNQWEKTVSINKCIWLKFVNFIFTPENSNMILCYLPFSHLSIAFSLSPCLSSPWICPGSLSQSGHVLRVLSLPVSWGWDSVYTAGYSFHLWSHNAGMYCFHEIHPLGVCQVCSPSVPKKTEKLLPPTEVPSGIDKQQAPCLLWVLKKKGCQQQGDV